MKSIYLFIILSLTVTACGRIRQQELTATAPATVATTVAATSNPSATSEPLVPPTDVPPAQPAATVPAPTETPSDSPNGPTSEGFADSDTPPSDLIARLDSHAGSISQDITYCTVAGVALKLDLYYPKNGSATTPLAVFIHGGGWSQGDKVAPELVLDGPGLLDAGITVASLNYRLAPQYQFPAMIEDVKCAIRSLRAHAQGYRIDPNHIGVWGTSAGGHLVNLLGTTDTSAGFDVGEYLDQSSRVQVVVDMFGPADMVPNFSPTYDQVRGPAFGSYDLTLASPMHYVTADDSPFLILQGDVDHVVPFAQSQNFYDALTAVGVDAHLVLIHGGNHGFTKPNEIPSRTEISTMIVDFLVTHLK